MLFLLRMLAVLGVLAVIARAGRALFSLLHGGVDMFLARDLHDVRAQRGDLTGMEEAVSLRRTGRRRRALAGVKLLFYIGLIVVPAYTSWPMHLRAVYNILWLLPRTGAPDGVRARFNVSVLP